MKPTVIDPKTTTRASAFDFWMHAPNPMVTFFKTMDVTGLRHLVILNEACNIDSDALGSSYTGTICGYEGSTAQTFAQEHGYSFVSFVNTPGNVYMDDKVDLNDAILVLQDCAVRALGEPSLLVTEQQRLADMNGNNKVGVDDAVEILQLCAQALVNQ